MRLVAGLHVDPLGELQRSPRPLSHNRGRDPTSKGEGEKSEGEQRGLPRLYLTSGYGACGHTSYCTSRLSIPTQRRDKY